MLALALNDAVLGFYPGFCYVYGAALIPVLLGRLIRNRSGAGAVAAAAMASSFSFFLITNFGSWLWFKSYPLTAAGLASCYVAAIPFFGWTLASDVVYTAILFGLHAWLTRTVATRERITVAA